VYAPECGARPRQRMRLFITFHVAACVVETRRVMRMPSVADQESGLQVAGYTMIFLPPSNGITSQYVPASSSRLRGKRYREFEMARQPELFVHPFT